MDIPIANVCAYLLFWVKRENAYGVRQTQRNESRQRKNGLKNLDKYNHLATDDRWGSIHTYHRIAFEIYIGKW